MKSFLKGNPPLKIALSEDLPLSKTHKATSCLPFDDYSFHDSVNYNEFDVNRILRINKPP